MRKNFQDSDGRLTNATAVQHSADGNSSRTSRSPCHRLPPRTPPSSLPSWGPEHGTMRVMLQKNPHEITLRFKLYPSMQSPMVIRVNSPQQRQQVQHHRQQGRHQRRERRQHQTQRMMSEVQVGEVVEVLGVALET